MGTAARQHSNSGLKSIGIFLLLLLATSCTVTAPIVVDEEVHSPHITQTEALDTAEIPSIVRHIPVVDVPKLDQAEIELYSVVVQGMPLREVLFAMARDAELNIDIHPDIRGEVNINALDQTLPQILQRIARQTGIRWYFDEADTLVVAPDLPFFRSYYIDYVNVSREAKGSISVSSTIGDSSGSTSATSLSQSSANSFWQTLTKNLQSILGEKGEESQAIVASPETGMINVNATAQQHKDIQLFVDSVMSRALSQVLIEATVVEVKLNDDFQAGVDWSIISQDSGVTMNQNLTGSNLLDAPTNVLSATRDIASGDIINTTISMLSKFGELKVLSSPKVMTLNNQAALLKVVDNKVYFTIEVQVGQIATATTPGTPNTYTSTAETVPVGFVMAVTPQISDSEQVTLYVRPTITRIVGFIEDPNPALADAGVVSLVPEIQVREIESILKVGSGQVAVLGGLMQDSIENNNAGLPVASKLPILGNLFKYQEDYVNKTELIIFIRPVVIKQPDINADLKQFRDYLPLSGHDFSELDSSVTGNTL